MVRLDPKERGGKPGGGGGGCVGALVRVQTFCVSEEYHLREDTIDGGQAQEATHGCHEGEEGEVPGVGGRLTQVESCLLGQQGRYAVVKVEQDCDKQRWYERSCYVCWGHILHPLQGSIPNSDAWTAFSVLPVLPPQRQLSRTLWGGGRFVKILFTVSRQNVLEVC